MAKEKRNGALKIGLYLLIASNSASIKKNPQNCSVSIHFVTSFKRCDQGISILSTFLEQVNPLNSLQMVIAFEIAPNDSVPAVLPSTA